MAFSTFTSLTFLPLLYYFVRVMLTLATCCFRDFEYVLSLWRSCLLVISYPVYWFSFAIFRSSLRFALSSPQ